MFITSDAQLLKFGADLVRPQGLSGGGMAGIKLDEGASVLFFAVVDPEGGGARTLVVVSVAGSGGYAARGDAEHDQGDAVPALPVEGARDRRGAAATGSSRARTCWPSRGPGRTRPGARPRRAAVELRRRRAAGTAPASGSASRSRRWAERPDERGPADHHRDQHRAPALAARPAGRHRGSVVPARRPAGPGRRPPPDLHHRHRDGRQPGAAGRVLQRVQPAGHAGLAPVAVPDAVREPTSGSTC